MAKAKFTIQGSETVTPEIIKIEKSLKNFQNQISGLTNTLGTMAKGAIAGFGLSQLKGIAEESVKVWMDWEKANQKLNASLNIGTQTNGGMIRSFQALADEMENLLNVDDKIVMSEAGKLATLGKTKSQIEEILKASADLSAGLGISFESATKGLTESLTGKAPEEIAKMIPAIKTMSEESLRAGGALTVVKNQFSGMAEASNQGAFASINRLTNGFENLQTEVGRFIANSTKPLTDFFASLVGGSAQTLNEINNLKESLQQLRTLQRMMGESEANFDNRALVAQKTALVDAWQQLNTPAQASNNNPLLQGGPLGRNIESNWENARIKFLATYGDALKLMDEKVGSNLWQRAKAGLITIYDIQNARAEAEKVGAELDKKIADNKAKANDNLPPLPTFGYTPPKGDNKDPEVIKTNWSKVLSDSQIQLMMADGISKKIAENMKQVVDATTKANEEAEKYNETIKAVGDGFNTFKQFLSPVTDFYNEIQNLQNQTAENELENQKKILSALEKDYDNKINLAKKAGQDTTDLEVESQNKIQSEKDKIAEKEKELKRKQFESDKQARLASTAMKMAEGIVSALTIAPPLGFVLSSLVGASGLAQLAMIQATPTPEFAIGTPYFQGGEAIVGERGREKVILPRGTQILPNSRTEASLGSEKPVVNNYYLNGYISSDMIKEIEREKAKLTRRGEL